MVEQLNALARLWWDWSAAMFWQAGLLILLIGCIDLVIRKRAWPQLRYALWSLILVKLILPPTLSLPSGIVPSLQPLVGQAIRWMDSEKPVAGDSRAVVSDCGLWIADSTLRVGSQLRMVAIANGGVQALVTDEDATVVDAALNANLQSAIANPQLGWQFYALLVWLAGTLILGIWLYLRLHSHAGRHAYQAAAASLPQSFYSQLAGCAKRLGLRRVPGVVVTRKLASPAVFGVFRPVLLMPRGYLSKLSRKDTEHMLLHELAHVKRGDLVMHGLYLLLQIVYWYNPLLWLVRRQVHHLRELSCDATVAEVLREQTPAYRQTLLETARRLLTSSVEPGLGLLGLFEDSNRLLVRLNWLAKPTWRYKTMKRVTVAVIAALMLACVLPMARAREAAPIEVEVRDPVNPQDAQLSQQMAELEARLNQLRVEQEQLQNDLRALAERRHQLAGERRERPEDAVGADRRRRERAVEDLDVTITPREAPAGRGGGRPGGREEIARAKAERARAEVGGRRARQEAGRAAAEGRRATVEAQRQRQSEWAKQQQQWAQHSEEMRNWQKQMQERAQAQARRRPPARPGDAAGQVPEEAPMPPVLPMPAMPPHPVPAPAPAPFQEDMDIDVEIHEPEIRVHVPPVVVPHIEMPAVEVPVPPAIPEKQEGQEEAVSRTEQEIDLAPGRLLEVKNDMGSIRVRGSNEPGCRLVVTVKGRAETMDEAQRIVDQTELVITPSQRGVYVTTTKPEKEDQRENAHRVVTMEIIVPRDARVRLNQAFGDIRLSNLDGSVNAVSNMGSIQASNVRGRVALESNFGAIDFIVPRDFSARVQAKSQMGTIRSDLPLEVAKSEGYSMGSKVSGTIGTGEGDVSLTTNMGSIRIRKQAAESEQMF